MNAKVIRSRSFLGVVLGFVLCFPAFSQETDTLATVDFESMFDQEDIIQDAEEASNIEDPHDDLLISDGIEIGGTVRGSFAADWFWSSVWGGGFVFFDPTSQSLTPAVGADLFFDSRPESAFRIFGKIKIDTATVGALNANSLSFATLQIDASLLPVGWTVSENEVGDTEIRDENGILIITIPAEVDGASEGEESGTGVSPPLDLNVFELFTDYTYQETLFFRFGKHTIHWGNGYFFSPADVLNLVSINPEDPTADREGPVSLRTHFPFGLTGNAYLYLIVNDQIEPLDIAVAPKVEFVVGPGELGIGAYYQRNLSPRLLTLYSVSVGDFDIFGEGVLLLGSDRVFVRPSRNQSAAETDPDDALNLVLDTYTIGNAIFAQATVGARYYKTWDGVLSLIAIGQYFFNGDGYGDQEEGLLPAAYRLMLFPGENGLALETDEQTEGYEPPPALSPTDLSSWGRHYAAAAVTASDLFGTDLDVSLLILANLSDFSGIISPSISYSVLDRFLISLTTRFSFGDDNDQLTDPLAFLLGNTPAPTLGITLSVTMPGGRF